MLTKNSTVLISLNATTGGTKAKTVEPEVLYLWDDLGIDPDEFTLEAADNNLTSAIEALIKNADMSKVEGLAAAANGVEVLKNLSSDSGSEVLAAKVIDSVYNHLSTSPKYQGTGSTDKLQVKKADLVVRFKYHATDGDKSVIVVSVPSQWGN